MPEPKMPFSGKPYPRSFATIERVVGVLSLVDVDISGEVIATWSDADRLVAYDWAFREHLRASDNLNRVPPMPEFVRVAPRTPRAVPAELRDTVFDIGGLPHA